MYFTDFADLIESHSRLLADTFSLYQDKLDAALTAVKLEGHTVDHNMNVSSEFENNFGYFQLLIGIRISGELRGIHFL